MRAEGLSRATLVVALGLSSAVGGCNTGSGSATEKDGIDVKESFLIWTPSQTLRDKHTEWHYPDNNLGTRGTTSPPPGS